MFIKKMTFEIIRKILDKQINQNDNVVDIGCGNGILAKFIEETYQCKITGTDIENYLKTKMPFRKMDNFEIRAKNKEFEISLLINVLHHVSNENQIKLIKEALRVSNEIIIIEQKPTFLAKILDIIINKVYYPKMPIPLTHKTRDEWQQLFAKNNIRHISQEINVPFYYPVPLFQLTLME